MSVSCKDGGVLPNTVFPWVDGMANEERAKTSLGHGANTASHTTKHLFTAVIISRLYL